MDKKFSELAQEKFSFLKDKHCFRCVSVTTSNVRFESDKIFVVVHYDICRSYEVGVEIGQKDVLFDGKERHFNLGEVLRLKGVIEKENYKTLQSSDSGSLISCLTKLSSWLEVYAIDFLKNDRDSFKRLFYFREKEGKQYEIETKLSHIRKEVEIAWNKKEYLKVSELYQPMENFLSEVEKKKLAFAQRQINNRSN